MAIRSGSNHGRSPRYPFRVVPDQIVESSQGMDIHLGSPGELQVAPSSLALPSSVEVVKSAPHL